CVQSVTPPSVLSTHSTYSSLYIHRPTSHSYPTRHSSDLRRTPNPCREAVRREPRRPLPEPLAGSSLTAPPVAASSASPHSYSAERRRAGQGIRKVQFLPGAPPHVA